MHNDFDFIIIFFLPNMYEKIFMLDEETPSMQFASVHSIRLLEDDGGVS